MTSAFDPDTFLSQQLNKELDTRYIPCPTGEFVAMIDDIKPRMVKTANGEDKLVLDIFWSVDDQRAKDETGRDKVLVKQSVWIDRTDSGGIDSGKGKNVKLGKVRDAVGQNRPGAAWAPSMLKGAVARIQVGHSVDKNNGDTYDNVDRVAKV